LNVKNRFCINYLDNLAGIPPRALKLVQTTIGIGEPAIAQCGKENPWIL